MALYSLHTISVNYIIFLGKDLFLGYNCIKWMNVITLPDIIFYLNQWLDIIRNLKSIIQC